MPIHFAKVGLPLQIKTSILDNLFQKHEPMTLWIYDKLALTVYMKCVFETCYWQFGIGPFQWVGIVIRLNVSMSFIKQKHTYTHA